MAAPPARGLGFQHGGAWPGGAGRHGEAWGRAGMGQLYKTARSALKLRSLGGSLERGGGGEAACGGRGQGSRRNRLVSWSAFLLVKTYNHHKHQPDCARRRAVSRGSGSPDRPIRPLRTPHLKRAPPQRRSTTFRPPAGDECLSRAVEQGGQGRCVSCGGRHSGSAAAAAAPADDTSCKRKRPTLTGRREAEQMEPEKQRAGHSHVYPSFSRANSFCCSSL